jgi:hypothetical protein
MEAVLDKPKVKPNHNIPKYLIYETMDGRHLYRKGYKEVLLGVKSFEEIMGSSKLQSFMIMFIVEYLLKLLPKQLIPLSSESGLNLDLNNNLATDIAIYDINEVGNIFEGKYFNTPPKVVFEIDIKIDLNKEKATDNEYITRKTKKLLKFGVEKVFWILTSTQTIIIAESGQSEWKIVDFSANIEPMEGIKFSLKQLVEARGFVLPDVEE